VETGRGTLVRQIMVEGVITCRADTTLQEVAALLDDAEISALVVVDDRGVAVGVISQMDVIKYYGQDIRSKRARDVLAEREMKEMVVSVAPGDHVEKAVRLMLDKDIHRVFILDEAGRPAGVVSAGDVIRDMRGISRVGE